MQIFSSSRRTLLKNSLFAILSSVLPWSPAMSADSQKKIMIYFSRTGSVATLAKMISKLTGIETLEIKPKVPYADDYYAMTYIAQDERNKGARREIATEIPDLSSYSTVFIGSPYWWGGVSIPLRTFLMDHPLDGKEVIPFCVSASSSPSGFWADIKKYCPKADIKRGFHTTESQVGSAEPAIKNWLRQLKQL